MAGSKKKTTQQTTAKRTASKGSRARTSAAAKENTAPKPAPQRPIRREVGGGICALLGLCTLFAMFGQDAPILKLLWRFGRGLVGWGMWVLPFLLIISAVMLFFHRGRPVRLRVACTLIISPIAGAIAHLFGDTTEYAFTFSMFAELYRAGAEGASGGILGGLTAWGLRSGLGIALSAVILFAALIAVAGIAANRRIKALASYLRERERVEYEPEPERERPAQPQRGDTANAKIDIPLEPAKPAIDLPAPGESHRETRKERRERRHLLRDRAADVVPPDEVLSGAAAPDPDHGRLPNEVAGPDDPVEPLDFTSTPEDERIADEVAANVRNIQAVEELKKSGDYPIVDPTTGEIVEPHGYDKPVLRPVASPEQPEPKIVDTLGGNRTAEQSVADKVASEVAEALGRSVASVRQGYVYPSTELLKTAPPVTASDATAEMKTNADRLGDTLRSFGIEAHIVGVTRGPSVTRYELELEQGTKLAKISGLASDIALSLGAIGVRIAPIPEKSLVVGIEVPNKAVATVSLREMLDSREFSQKKSPVTFALGKDISGNAIMGDIEKMPHMLIAGTTGSGKSVCMNSLIISLLYKSSPEDVRLIMVDPKMVEFNVYNGIPHLLIPVVTDPKKAAGALQWAVHEMMNRYAQFRDASVRNIDEYNSVAESHEGMKRLPRVVILIDELADLMLVAAKEVEESICRVAQMGRASGVHLVIATQSPRADVITGLMKANIPSRVAFAVASSLESRIIMDSPGAETLVGRGDMLYLPIGSRKPTRIQGCFVSSGEVEKVVDFVKQSSETEYSEEVLSQIEKAAQGGADAAQGGGSDGADDCDEMLPQAVEVLLETGQASVSMLQRRLKLGYARAARLVDQLERRGIVGPFEGAKPRQLLVTREQWEEMKLQNPEYQ